MMKRTVMWMLMPLAGLILSACSSTSLVRAPVVDVKGTGSKLQHLGAENAGKPGYYTVVPGDTLLKIGLEKGQSPRDLVKWNKLANPNLIEVGEVLRVIPPAGEVVIQPMKSTVTPASIPASSVQVRPINNLSRGVNASSLGEPASGAVTAGTITTNATTTGEIAANATQTNIAKPKDLAPMPNAGTSASPVQWMWPTTDAVSEGFNDATNKGLNFSGMLGDPIHAAASGVVVYVGNGLRGYGNLIILKHNEQFLTAYAHNQTLMVKEDQVVKRGQQIATMGDTDASKPMLHFEVRKDGKPVDPTKFLPAK